MKWEDVPPGMLQEPVPTLDDVLAARQRIKASVDPEDIKLYEDWTEKNGSYGS